MNPVEITKKIKQTIKSYLIVNGYGEMFEIQFTVQVYYSQYHEAVWMEIGDLTSKQRELQREACKKRLGNMLKTDQFETIQTSRIFDKNDPDKVGAIRWKEGIVVMSGTLGYISCEQILAVALYRLKLIDEKSYKQIKEELKVEEIGEPRNEKFFNLLLCVGPEYG